MTASNRTSDFSRDDKPIRHEAADWLARRHGGFAPADQVAFDRWVAADPLHRATLAEMESAWDLINAPVAAGRSEALRRGLSAQVRQRAFRRQRRFFASLSLAAAAAIVFAFLPRETPAVADPTLAPTMTFRPDKRTLPDGSTVEFNAGAEIALEFTVEKRGVRLVRGEVHFVVAKDANRSFVVSAGAVDVKAVGTAFAVRFDPKQIDVLVTEGRVAVQSLSPTPETDRASDAAVEPIYLAAGARVALPATILSVQAAKIETLSPPQVVQALAWRDKRIEFSHTPLAEAVALFNRQNEVQITIANRADEARRINGVFWADDPAGFARLLEMSLGLTMKPQDKTIVLRGR